MEDGHNHYLGVIGINFPTPFVQTSSKGAKTLILLSGSHWSILQTLRFILTAVTLSNMKINFKSTSPV